MMKRALFFLGACALMQACQTHHDVDVAPVEIKPIHITLDVKVKVDRALNDFFNELDSAEKKIEIQPAGEQP